MNFQQGEQIMVATADQQLPTLALAEEWSQELARVIAHLPLERGNIDTDGDAARVLALAFVGALGVRSMRSFILFFRNGYEIEALASLRRLTECWGRAEQFRDPNNGAAAARGWLDNKAFGGPAKLFADKGNAWGVWGNVSHADARAIDHLMIDLGDRFGLQCLPMRRDDPSDGWSNYHVGLATDVARELAFEIVQGVPPSIEIHWDGELDVRLNNQKRVLASLPNGS